MIKKNTSKMLGILLTLLLVLSLISCSSSSYFLNKESDIYTLDAVLDNSIVDIEKGLSSVLAKYDSKDVVIRACFGDDLNDIPNFVQVNFNYQGEIPNDKISAMEDIYDDILGFSKQYYTNPNVLLTLRDIDDNEIVYPGEIEEIVKENPVEILSIEFSNKKNGYINVDVNVLNQSGRNIDYIKLDFHYYDAEGNEFKSNWTNDSATIRDGATQVISKKTEDDFSKVEVVIDDISYE